MADTDVVCLFAFAATQPEFGRELPQTEFESRLMLLHAGAVTALVGLVPAADFRGPEGDRNLGDIAWIAPRVRRHAALVEWAMQDCAVFPVPFATLYLSVHNLTQFMRAHEPAITGFLGKVAGKREWELRAFAQLDAVGSVNRMAAAEYADWPDLTAGKRYMRLSRDKPLLIEKAHAEAALVVGGLVAELQPLTADVRQNEAGFRRDEAGNELIARYACLVPERDEDAFHAGFAQAARMARAQDIALTLSGPWPPFSFRPDLHALESSGLARE